MRNVLLIFGLLVSTSLAAQRFELGVNSGLGFNGKTKSIIPSGYLVGGELIKYTDVFSVKGLYYAKKWQIGLSVDARRASYKLPDYSSVIVCLFYDPSADQRPHVYVKYGSYYPIKFFTNRTVKLNNFELYGGLSAGYVLLSGVKPDPSISDLTMDMETRQRTADYRINHGTSFTAGAQIGCTYFVSRHIGLNVEVNADYVQFRQGPQMRSQMVSVPIMLGLRYR